MCSKWTHTQLSFLTSVWPADRTFALAHVGFGLSKTSDSNCYSASQMRRVSITPRSRCVRLNPHLQRILVGVPQLSLSPLTGVPRRGLIRNKLRYLDTNNIHYRVVEHNTVCSAIASPYSSGDHSDYSAFLARQRIAICCRRIIEDNPLRMVVSRIANVAIGFEPITTPHVRGRSCQLSYTTWACFFTAHLP